MRATVCGIKPRVELFSPGSYYELGLMVIQTSL
jgi:hypothetical protein